MRNNKALRPLVYGLLAVIIIIGAARVLSGAIPSGSSVLYTGSDTITLPAGVVFNAPTATITSLLTSAGATALSGVISPTQITANQNDYNPTGLSTASVLRLSTTASWNLTGLMGGTAGRLVLLHNVGIQNLVLVSESTSSTAANRFEFPGDLTLIPKAMVLVQYDGTSLRWHTSYPSLTAGPVSASLLNMTIQSGDPTPPGAGILTLYAKLGGVFTRDNAGNIDGPFGTGGGGGTGTGCITARVASTENLDLTGEETIDGITTNTSIVLAKNQTTASENGPYTSSTIGWQRLSTYNETAEWVNGLCVYVNDGTSGTGNRDTVWHFTPGAGFTLNTTAITFVKTGAGPTGEILANKNINSGYMGLTSTGDAPWDRVESYATHTDLSATSQIDAATHQKRMLGIQSSLAGNVTLSSGNPRITGCTSDNDGVRLLLVGLSPTKTVTIPTGQGVLLAGNAGSVVIGQPTSTPPSGTSAEFRCNGSTTTWEQVSIPSLQQAANVAKDIDGATSSGTAVRIGDIAGGNYCRFYGNTIDCFCSGSLCSSTTVKNLVFAIDGSKPTCSSVERFKVWVTAGGAGVQDLEEVCDKNSSDVYAWRTLGGSGGSTRTTTFPLKLSSVQVTDANAFIDTIDGTNIDYSGLRMVDAVTGCGFYTHKIVPNLATTPAWNIILTSKAMSGVGGNAVFSVTGKDFASNAALDAPLTSLVASVATAINTSANITISTMSGSSFDGSEAIAANNLLVVKVCREGGSGSDTLSADLLLLDVSVRYDVN